jgi:hypothetical protein
MFYNGIYYSGDTAQAIQKGVAFKFSDIKEMYRKDRTLDALSFSPPKQHNLTVNFRSHSQILQLANIIGVI